MDKQFILKLVLKALLLVILVVFTIFLKVKQVKKMQENKIRPRGYYATEFVTSGIILGSLSSHIFPDVEVFVLPLVLGLLGLGTAFLIPPQEVEESENLEDEAKK